MPRLTSKLVTMSETTPKRCGSVMIRTLSISSWLGRHLLEVDSALVSADMEKENVHDTSSSGIAPPFSTVLTIQQAPVLDFR